MRREFTYFFIHMSVMNIFIRSSYLHPLPLAVTTKPVGVFTLGSVFLLKMIMGRCMSPLAVQDNTIVRWHFSARVIRMLTVLSPTLFNVLFGPRSIYIGILFMLRMCCKWYWPFCLTSFRKLQKSTILLDNWSQTLYGPWMVPFQNYFL